MIKDDFDFVDESIDEQKLLYEISRLQERLDRMENDDESYDGDWASELDRISAELNFMKKECEVENVASSRIDQQVEHRTDKNTEKVDEVLQKIDNLISQEDFSDAISTLKESVQILKNIDGENVAQELASLKTVIESCPQVERPVAKKDDIYAIKQFSDIKRLLGSFDDRYEKYLSDNSMLIDSLAEVEITVSSPTVPFVEKLFAMLNLYNLLSDSRPEKAIVDSFNNMVVAFFEQNLSAEKLEKLFYLSEVSSLYKITDENRAKAKKLYALYDEVLAVRPSKQLAVIEKIYELKVDLCKNTENEDKLIEKLRNLCGKNPPMEEVKKLLNELMILPIRCIVDPPILSLSHVFESVAPVKALSDVLKDIVAQVTEISNKVSNFKISSAQIDENKSNDVEEQKVAFNEQLLQLEQKLSSISQTNNSLEHKEEIILAIGVLKDEIQAVNLKLDKISEYDEDVESYIIESGSEIDEEEIELSDTDSRKVDQLLNAVEAISTDIKEISVSTRQEKITVDEESQKKVLSEFTEIFRSYMEGFKGEVSETLSLLRQDFNEIKGEIDFVKKEIAVLKDNSETSCEKLVAFDTTISSVKETMPVTSVSVQSGNDADKFVSIDKVLKELKSTVKLMHEQVKIIKKDVESVKERNQRIYNIARQVEAIKNKVDSLHRAGIAEKEANIIKQLKALQNSVDKLVPSAIDKKEASTLKKSVRSEKEVPSYLDKDDVAQSIDSLKKELSAIMKLVNDEK